MGTHRALPWAVPDGRKNTKEPLGAVFFTSVNVESWVLTEGCVLARHWPWREIQRLWFQPR